MAVELLGAAGDGYVALGVQYFQIPMAARNGGFVAAGLPARVDAPEAAPSPRPVGEMSPPTGSEFDAAVQGFLTAYLTGRGDIDLYSSAAADIRPAASPPFAEVALRRVGVEHAADGGFLVVAEYVGIDSTGRRIVSEARLSVTSDWKVLAVLAGLPAG